MSKCKVAWDLETAKAYWHDLQINAGPWGSYTRFTAVSKEWSAIETDDGGSKRIYFDNSNRITVMCRSFIFVNRKSSRSQKRLWEQIRGWCTDDLRVFCRNPTRPTWHSFEAWTFLASSLRIRTSIKVFRIIYIGRPYELVTLGRRTTRYIT
jgi:hypothetical protein